MPTALATCEVYGTIHDVFGQPVQGAVVGVMAVYKNGALILSRTKEVQTDVDGYFTLELPRGPDCVAILYANTPGLNISALGTPTAIPDADAAELVSIIGDFELWDQVPVAIPIGAGVSSFNGRTGAIVLTSADVTGALGYTPADAAALAGYLLLAGGTMTGPLALAGAPTLALHAATKAYVDATAAAAGVVTFNGRSGAVTLTSGDVTAALGYTPANSAALAGYLLLAGGTMAGPLILSHDPVAALEAATRQWVLAQIGAIPAGGVTSFNSRTGAVMPAGADYSAFYAALSHTHTKAQITDLGIFSTAQPGLVPQPTAGDAAKFLTGAGTWAAAAAGGVDLAANYAWTGAHTWTQALSGTAQFRIQQTADQYGTTSLTLNNRDANVGLLLKNSGLDVVDFNAEGSSGGRHTIRFEHRSGTIGSWISMAANSGGEFRIQATLIYANLDFNFAGSKTATLGRDPTAALEAATKQYVDSHAGAGAVTSVFTRTGAVVALVGDYSAFYAALSHTHTRAQITDLGIFSTSAPGLVPSPASASTTLFLNAAGTFTTPAGGGGGGTPAGTGAEIQYRASASAFGAATGSAVYANGSIDIFHKLRLRGATAGGGQFTSFSIASGGAYSAAVLTCEDVYDATPLTPFSMLSATHWSDGGEGILAFGFGYQADGVQSARQISFVTSPDGASNSERLSIGPAGAINVGSGARLYLYADPTAALEAATKQYVDAHAGGGSGSVDLAANYAWTGAHSWTQALTVQGATVGSAGLISPTAISLNHGSAVPYTGLYISQASNGATFTNANYGGVDLVDFLFQVVSGQQLRIRAEMRGGFQAGGEFKFSTWGYNDLFSIGSAAIVCAPIVSCAAGIYVGVGQIVTLGKDPVNPLEAATKQYVDAHGTSAGVASFNGRTGAVTPALADYTAFFVEMAGDTMTGALTLSGNPSSALHAVPKQYVDAKLAPATAAGANFIFGTAEELITLSTGASTTDSAANLLPAGAIILSVTGRVTTTIGTAANWKLGDGNVNDRFTSNNVTMTAGTTDVGLNCWQANRTTANQGPSQAAAAKVRITLSTTPTAGAVRVTVFYMQFTAATS